MMSSKVPILVDMDGVLADFDAKYWDVAVDMFGPSTFDITSRDEQVYRFLDNHQPDGEQAVAVRAQVSGSHWFRDLPLIDGAVSGMDRLADEFDVWICTKPYVVDRDCYSDKAKWLADNLGDKWVHKLILAPDKSLVHGVVLIDDAIKPQWLKRASWLPVVYDCPWNKRGTKHGGPGESEVRPEYLWRRFSWDQPDSIERLICYVDDAVRGKV